mmetsp:Transcript_1366/g.2238  ORF Transcript_1366/g.2238 Transcript_1366/m.2238 type:complete len:210 (+) Transcript_1366:1351-1980(+)
METQNGNKEKHEQLQRGRNAVHDEVLHALKDTSGHDDALDDGGQPFLCEHDVRRCSGSVRSAGHRNTNVSSFQCWGIVHSIASHAGFKTHLTETLDDKKLVFRKHLCEAVAWANVVPVLLSEVGWSLLCHGIQHGQTFRSSNNRHHSFATEYPVTQLQHSRSLHCDEQVVSSDHLHLNTVGNCSVNGFLGINTRRIQECKESQHLPHSI